MSSIQVLDLYFILQTLKENRTRILMQATEKMNRNRSYSKIYEKLFSIVLFIILRYNSTCAKYKLSANCFLLLVLILSLPSFQVTVEGRPHKASDCTLQNTYCFEKEIEFCPQFTPKYLQIFTNFLPKQSVLNPSPAKVNEALHNSPFSFFVK